VTTPSGTRIHPSRTSIDLMLGCRPIYVEVYVRAAWQQTHDPGARELPPPQRPNSEAATPTAFAARAHVGAGTAPPTDPPPKTFVCYHNSKLQPLKPPEQAPISKCSARKPTRRFRGVTPLHHTYSPRQDPHRPPPRISAYLHAWGDSWTRSALGEHHRWPLA